MRPAPPSTDRHRTRRRARRPVPSLLVGAAVAALLGGAACASTGSVEAGGAGSGPASTPASGPGSSAGAGSTTLSAPPNRPTAGATPPTTCVEGPATTTPFDAGGGRITCSASDPAGSASSPPMTDTTIPTPGTTLVADATHGVVVVSASGGYDCGNDPCPAIAMLMSGTITADAADGTTTVATLDAMGRAGLRLEPGQYGISAQVTVGSCESLSTSVTAGSTTDIGLVCTVPMR